MGNADLEFEMRLRTSGLVCVLIAATFAARAETAKEGERPIRVECHGLLRHGVAAIGGETTGTTIKFDGTTWELQFKDDASRKFAAAHHKKPVSVFGSLRRVTGVEVPARWIVDVEQLLERDTRTHNEGAVVTFLGKLRTKVAGTDGTDETVVEADGIAWRLDLTADAMIQTRAKSLAQKLVLVKGRIKRVSKAMFPECAIIHVSKLDTPPDNSPK